MESFLRVLNFFRPDSGGRLRIFRSGSAVSASGRACPNAAPCGKRPCGAKPAADREAHRGPSLSRGRYGLASEPRRRDGRRRSPQEDQGRSASINLIPRARSAARTCLQPSLLGEPCGRMDSLYAASPSDMATESEIRAFRTRSARRFDVFVRSEAAEAEPNGSVALQDGEAQGTKDVRRFGNAGGVCCAGCCRKPG